MVALLAGCRNERVILGVPPPLEIGRTSFPRSGVHTLPASELPAQSRLVQSNTYQFHQSPSHKLKRLNTQEFSPTGAITKALVVAVKVPKDAQQAAVITKTRRVAKPTDALDGLGLFVAKVVAVVGFVFLLVLVLGLAYGSAIAAILGGIGFALAALGVYAICKDIHRW